jgi:hypothetical protein
MEHAATVNRLKQLLTVPEPSLRLTVPVILNRAKSYNMDCYSTVVSAEDGIGFALYVANRKGTTP